MNFKNKFLALVSLTVLLTGCPAPGTSSNPSSNPSAGVTNDKASFVKFLNCAISNSKSDSDKSAIQTVLSLVNLVPDIAWQNAKGAYEQYYKMYEKFCESGSSTPSTSPSVTPVNLTDKVAEGMVKHTCDKEGSFKSTAGKAVNIDFVNKSTKKLKVYWLDYGGKRVPYNANLASGQTHKQGTFVTHPWLIADENDKCLQIYIPGSEKSTLVEIENF